MSTEPRLPEIERGTEVFAVDPLTIRTHFEVDYLHSYKQDTPFFHGLAKRKLLPGLAYLDQSELAPDIQIDVSPH